MKAITLYQPFASLVAVGTKNIITRPSATSYRGALAIHAARKPPKQFDPYFQSVLGAKGLNMDDLPLGAIVALCCLKDCQEITTINCPCYPEFAFSEFNPGWFAWMLSDIRAVSHPISARGYAGLWQWRD